MKRAALLFLAVAVTAVSRAQLGFDVESGAAVFGYNDVGIPGNSGTRFSLKNDFKSDPVIFFRARVHYNIARRHAISALYAPLTVKGEGSSSQPINFENTVFNANTQVSSTWKFNSYRFTYQYSLILREKFVLAIGLTAKVRDAKIRLENSDVAAEKTNLGVVPLVRFYADWTFAKRCHLVLDGDALVGSQGRAEDILLAFNYAVFNNLRLKAGYRLLEGGADNNEVYNFSSVHYAVLGLTLQF